MTTAGEALDSRKNPIAKETVNIAAAENTASAAKILSMTTLPVEARLIRLRRIRHRSQRNARNCSHQFIGRFQRTSRVHRARTVFVSPQGRRRLSRENVAQVSFHAGARRAMSVRRG